MSDLAAAERSIAENRNEIRGIRDRVAAMETGQAVLAAKLDNLGETVKTGMIDLGAALKARDEALATERREERKSLLEEGIALRAESRWWWGKVFAILGAIVSLAGGVAGVSWYAGDTHADAKNTVEVSP